MSANAQNAVHTDSVGSADTVQRDTTSIRRVLVVDEQAHVLRVMRLNLDRLGYEVDTALSSENALLLMRKHPYDALIMTSDLPDMSTQQLCDNAARYCHTTVPLILVSGDGDDDWIDSSVVVERLSSPVSLRQIVTRLGEIFADNP